MADATHGVTKVYGYAATGYESLTSNFEFINVATNIPIYTFTQSLTAQSVTLTTALPNQLAQARANQANFDKLIQIISLRGQPVIMGAVVLNTSTYSFILAVEHASAWSCTATSGSSPTYTSAGQPWPDARSNEDLLNRIKIDGVNCGFGAHVSIVYNDPISGGSYTHNIDDTSSLAVTFNTLLT